MRNYDMTNKRFYILLKAFYEVYGRTPTIEEIEGYTGLDIKTINYHLTKLDRLGKIELITKQIKFIRIKENIYE